MARFFRTTAVATVLAAFADHAIAAAVTGPSSNCPARFPWEDSILTDADVAASGDPARFAFGDDITDDNLKHRHRGGAEPADCRAFPGNPSWPSAATWSLLNTTLSGTLLQTVPLAAPCYADWPAQYDAAVCANLTTNWGDPYLHIADPTSAMFPLFQGLTCLPTDNPTGGNCTLGGFASYSVAAKETRQIQLAVNFARNENLRLVVKNTGHDFADKSIGAGALSVWTHGLKDIEFVSDYSCQGYSGPAFKLGSGVITDEIYAAAEEHEVTVVGGVCRTVGITGGYIAGGGHSPMAPLVGMGADQVLSMEVVLPNGRFVSASADENPDLFWALRGGGGSTYGVVTSVTIRAYPKIPVTTMTFSYATSENLTADTFFDGLGAYMKYFDTFSSAGAYGYFFVAQIAPEQYVFSFFPMWGANYTKPEFTKLVTPYLNDLADLGIPIEPIITEYPSHYQAFLGQFPAESVGGYDNHAASRLFPKDNFKDPAKRAETLAAVRYAIEDGGVLVGYNIRAAVNPAANQDNSVNPAWREATGFFILAVAWGKDATDEEIAQASEKLTTDWMGRWRAVSPGAGSYMSEGDINEPDFQQAFYGTHYPRLRALKEKYDPTSLFYAPTAVGSEDWYITDQIEWFPKQTGRLCRKKSS
ncbi:hypothetical protein B0J18DRAFT_53995 [Chaetomium sp. MPI-SDFR-AT-0129]|nr:hypothetical protein B0J18DRAFT_53995 [Chaetomium sp. MPI-SDFR-AT-0129]